MLLLSVIIVLNTFDSTSASCNAPFRQVGENCYFYEPTLFVSNYNTAREFCATLGGHLAIVKNFEENQLIVDGLLIENGM